MHVSKVNREWARVYYLLMDDSQVEQVEVNDPVVNVRDFEAESEAEAAIAASLSHEAMRARWQGRRPNIFHLKSGVVVHEAAVDDAGEIVEAMTLPLFDIGDRIVIDVRTNFLPGDPWLHTLVGKVRSIDDDTGIVSVLDEETDPRNPMVRWVSFKNPLQDFRLAPAKGDPFAVSAVRAAAKPVAPVEGKRGRGRPKGSTNRSKEEIAAERAAYRKLREEKKARRGR